MLVPTVDISASVACQGLTDRIGRGIGHKDKNQLACIAIAT
jgi:hypothetical protein